MDRRKALNLAGDYFLSKFAEFASDKTGINKEDIEWLSFSEIVDVLKGKKFDVEEVCKRREALFCWYDSRKSFFISGEKAKKYISKLALVFKNIDIVEGMVAYPGKVMGKIKVILDPRKGTIEPGEILFTSMTRPDFLMLMDKAAAFITDEGGITSHAGILAREMKKPCIVGTKIATKVFKNGELVEVDANHGKIIKIK